VLVRSRYAWPAAVVAALVAAGLHVACYQYVNPTAALRLGVSRGTATQVAYRFLSSEHVAIPAGYRQATTFVSYGHPKAYLEQTLGLAKANGVLQSEGMVYRWAARWFKPGEYEEYNVDVDPDGRILGYSHDLPDDAPAPASKQPRQVAEQFLKRVAGLEVRDYWLQDSSREPRPKRRDYGFTWERRGFRLGEARQRVSLVVTGDKVISYDRYLWVPESFDHQFATQQNKGDLLADVSGVLAFVFVIVGIVVIISGIRRRTLHWRAALLIGAVVAIVGLLNDLNLLPLAYADFSVSQTEFSFFTDQVMAIVMAMVGRFLGAAATVVAAESLFRSRFPDGQPIHQWFTKEGIAAAGGRRRLAAGYLLALGHLGYVSVFYFLATKHLNAWAPAQVPYDDLFSTAVPWAYALLIGVQPAVSEEFLFRVLAISWLRRLVKRDWLAILIPALIWGFAHCNYPNKPFYIRGVELSIWGCVLGWVFVRFGVLPGLVAHATFNSTIVGEAFLSSVVWLPRLNFAVVVLVVLIPLAAATWWWRQRAAAPAPEPQTNAGLDLLLLDRAARGAALIPLEETEPAWRPLPRRSWIIGGIALVVGSALIVVLGGLDPDKPSRDWKQAEIKPWQAKCVSRGEAVGIAEAALGREQARVEGWYMSAAVQEGGLDGESQVYLERYLRSGDVEELGQRMATPAFLWAVKWQKPLARESWRVRLTADGRIWDVRHALPEEASGAHLPAGQAQHLAEDKLRQLGFDLRRFRLTGSRQHEYLARTAHVFTWEPRGLRIGQSQFLTEVTVDGDRVNWVGRRVEPPESFVFQRSKETARESVGAALSAVIGLALLLVGIGSYFGAVRSYQVPWRWAFRIAAWLSVPLVALGVLMSATAWAGLSATMAPAAYMTGKVLGVAAALATMLAGGAALLAVARSVWRFGLPDVPGPGFWWQAFCWPWRHRRQWREAVMAVLLVIVIALPFMAVGMASDELISATRRGAAASGGAVELPAWIVESAALLAPDGGGGTTDALASFSPTAVNLLLALVVSAFLLLVWLAAVGLAKRMFRTKRVAMMALAVVSLLPVFFEAKDWQEATTYVVSAALALTAFWTAFVLVLRWNPLTVGALGILLWLCVGASDQVWFAAHRAGAVVLGGIAAVIVLWALTSSIVAWRSRRPEPGPDESAEVAPAVAGPIEVGAAGDQVETAGPDLP
jgi:membrane protease YdiL (CAAX protease family)